MSRPIKFRAWVNEHWVDWLPNSKTLGEYNEVGIYDDEYETESKCFIEQYTGLKDKNGKEIYEGDIMSDHSIVRFSDDPDEVGSCGCCVPEFFGTCFIISNDHNPEQLEVIGNIHENLELLEGKE